MRRLGQSTRIKSAAPGKYGISESFLGDENRNQSLSFNPSGPQSPLENTEQNTHGKGFLVCTGQTLSLAGHQGSQHGWGALVRGKGL